MNDFVNKANSIEEDIKGMPILDQIKYAANLYQKMNKVMGEEMGDMNVFIKAQTKVECVWRCLAAEYKGGYGQRAGKTGCRDLILQFR